MDNDPLHLEVMDKQILIDCKRDGLSFSPWNMGRLAGAITLAEEYNGCHLYNTRLI